MLIKLIFRFKRVPLSMLKNANPALLSPALEKLPHITTPDGVTLRLVGSLDNSGSHSSKPVVVKSIAAP